MGEKMELLSAIEPTAVERVWESWTSEDRQLWAEGVAEGMDTDTLRRVARETAAGCGGFALQGHEASCETRERAINLSRAAYLGKIAHRRLGWRND